MENKLENQALHDKKINQYLEFEEKYGKDAISKLLDSSEKEKIVSGLIKDEELFNNLSKYNMDSFKIFFKNPKTLNSILNGELSDNEYSSSSKVTSENKSINVSFNSEITKDKVLLNFFNNSLPSFLQYAGDFDFGNKNSMNIRTGVSGEAYIYELLSNSGKYKSVKWNMIDKTGQGEDFEYNGKHYKIHCDGSQYDILVETFEGQKIYVEVKSTKNKFNNKVPFYLSLNQIEKMKQIKVPNEYVLAIVFNVMIQPKHFFMTLKNKIP